MLKNIFNCASAIFSPVNERKSTDIKEEVVETSSDGTTTTMVIKENDKPVKIVTKIVEEHNHTPPHHTNKPKVEEHRPPQPHPVPKSPPAHKHENKHDEPNIDKMGVEREERPDPVVKCGAIVVAGEFKDRLDLADYDFSKVDEYARATTPRDKTDSVKQLAEYLTAPWDNELDKLRSIFTWISENISYDAEAYFSGERLYDSGPEGTLRTRKGVCEGYAGLFEALASATGLKVWKISGKAKGIGYAPGTSIDSSQYSHAWNGVVYKGEFLLIDSTWGSGIIKGQHYEKRFEPFYFLCKPTKFIYSHFPNDPNQQYLSPQLTGDEFLDLTYVKPPFFTSELEFRKYYGNVIVTENDQLEVEIARFSPDNGKPLHAELEWKGQSIPVMIQRLAGYGDENSGRVYKLQATCPSSGEGKLEIFVMLKGTSGPLAASLRVVNKGTGSNHATYVETFTVPFSYTIHTPIHSKLHLNKPDAKTKFEFSVFDLPEDKHPVFSLFTPSKQIRHLEKVSRCEDVSVTYALETCVDQTGEWTLVHSEKNSPSFSFIAQYVVVD